jgi:hypothetical protein
MKEVLRSVSRTLSDTDFFLAGGTALALLEGHRISIDLDLFSATFEDPEYLLLTVERALPNAVATLIAPRTLYLDIDGTSVSMMGYEYPPLAPVLRTEPDLLPLASRDDIAAMKLAAIASRGSRKDFVDLWWLVTRHRSLPEYLGLFSEKFRARDVGHVVRALTFFDDADLEPPLRYLAEIDWDRVKRDIACWVVELVSADES